MHKLVGDHILALKPYQPGKPIEELERELGITNIIKLASNENPLGPSPKAMEAMRATVDGVHIYPDGAAYELRKSVAAFMDVPMSEVVTGNGSNELLTLTVRTFVQPGENVVVSDYAFIVYRLAAMYVGAPIKSIPMAEGMVHDLEAMADAIDEDTKLVFVANPNNPTGSYVGRAGFEAFLKRVPDDVIVVVDEAYVEYAQADDFVSAADLRHLHEKMIVTRTMSKIYGLAGLRIGFAVGPEALIGMMHRVRDPFNANLMAQQAARVALSDTAFVAKSVETNERGRQILEDGLAKLKGYGVTWIPSQTNFLLIHTPYSGATIYDKMLRQGVIIRPMAGYGIPDHLRITIGTPEQTERCLRALEQALSEVAEA